MDTRAIKIAVVDDDDRLREKILLPGLRDFGFEAIGFASAAELYRVMLGESFDAILLDINLPGENGMAVVDYLRSIHQQLGILMLSAQHGEQYKIESLSKGADGYLEKPASIKVIAATLHSLIRRVGRSSVHAAATPHAAEPGKQTAVREPSVAHAWYLTAPNGEVIALSVTEQRLFRALQDGNGEPVGREALIAAVADDVYSFDVNHLDMIVHRLRKKLLESNQSSTRVVTIRGLGYALKRQ